MSDCGNLCWIVAICVLLWQHVSYCSTALTLGELSGLDFIRTESTAYTMLLAELAHSSPVSLGDYPGIREASMRVSWPHGSGIVTVHLQTHVPRPWSVGVSLGHFSDGNHMPRVLVGRAVIVLPIRSLWTCWWWSVASVSGRLSGAVLR